MVEYNTQRTCGVWLVYIGSIIIFAALLGREFLIQPYILGFGFFIGYIAIFSFPYVNRKLAYGKSSKFQDRMDNLSVLVNVILCTLCGLLIGFSDLRLLWLCIFLAVGFHFFGFYFSQGKVMLWLAALTMINAAAGLLFASIPFLIFALIDGLIKIVFGVKMLQMKQQVKKNKADTVSIS
ncbi:DUF6609 family protein [Alkalihalobacterium bogoriense]|uniref:DUF6609 family protein n=1 Tax=Alkalihalobacterium bogoriense TaxID=246272 RepID=UPI0027E49D4E|nr:DUF6609 family protein [Alkalihalobacterium bogoriense]